MTELPATDATKLLIAHIADKHITSMMEELSDTDFTDEEILAVLRDGGYGHEADMFEDWIADEEPDPEGPGGYVTDPPSDSYIELAKQLDEQRKAASITYEWTERERMIYSCKATVNRSQLQTWLNAHWPHMEVEDLDPEVLVEFLEANPGASMDERRWPADDSETDCFDLKVVDQ